MDYDPTTGHAIPPYEGWNPYCLVCDTMLRMMPIDGGWKCDMCRNEIGLDLQHKSGSPVFKD
jgi:hypothetical protein